jgi:predicted dinucleotide-binding enzyme
MKIAVIGAGKIGGTIGGKWEAAGHEVVFGLRDPSKKGGAQSIARSLTGAEAVLLAVPANALRQLAHEHAKDLDGKVLIDATNHFGGAKFHQWDELAASLPHAELYRAFNSYGFDVFENATIGGTRADLFFAGPEGPGKGKVEKLIQDVGLRPIWVGGAEHSDTVDGVLQLWLTLSRSHGRRIAFKLLTD